jgi:hypothetical protein
VKNIVYSGTAEGSPWGALTVNGVIDGDFVYADAEKKRITAYVGNNSAVTIPNTVTSIGVSAFRDCKILTSITIPSSVTSIEHSNTYVGAFDGCDSIETLTYNTNAIGSNFSNKKLLKTINIGDAVTSIGGYAFYNCSSLISIVIPNSVTSIEEGAFNSCNGLTSITIPNSITSIGNWAFSNCSSLTTITIPNSVTSIGEYAFDNCISLTSVTIPNSITSISNGAFSKCSSLTSVTIPNSVTTIGNGAFKECGSLASITIPNSVTSIGEEAFNMDIIDSYYFNLKTVTIPNSVTSIGNSAFRDIKNIVYNGTAEGSPWGALTVNGVVDGDFVYADAEKTRLTAYVGNGSTVTIPNSVTNIGYYAFRGCKNLKMVTIPNSVTSIDYLAFYLIKNIVYNGTAEGSPWGALTVNGVVDGDFVYADAEKKQLTAYIGNGGTATIPNSVTSIGYYAFKDSYGLKTVIIPNSVMSIGNRAFINCSDLTSVTIPNSVTNIGVSAFGNCGNLQYNEYDNGYYIGNDDNPYVCLIKAKPTDTILTSCEINSNCKVIYNNAFEDCYSLLSIEIPNSVTSIGERAFYRCGSLTKVTIPNSVTSIGIMAFIGCSNQLQYNEYDNCCYLGNDDNPYLCLMKTISDNITSCEINSNCKIIYGSGSWEWNYKGGLESLTSVEIPNSVTSISGCAFYNCNGLTTIEIPSSVTSIGWGAFNGCNNLTIYCEATEKPSGWEDDWNGYRPVYWAGANAVTESVANAVNIYAYSNKIVVENATDEIRVFNAMGALVCRDVASRVRAEININGTGIYIVKTGNTVKRVMVN